MLLAPSGCWSSPWCWPDSPSGRCRTTSGSSRRRTRTGRTQRGAWPAQPPAGGGSPLPGGSAAVPGAGPPALARLKSTITAVEALSLTDQPHHLTVIGEGTLQEHLQQRAVELGLRDRVRFVPFLPRAELWRLLPDFDAFVFTTTGLEAFGLVLIEAQAHGLPVVYSNLPGVKETLGGAGVPYTPGDPRSLAAALDGMGRAPHRRKALSKAALDNARRYDIAATGRRLRELTIRVTS
ncbi:glycosyltransferase family 4 protein [Streptomyces uncialis]|uniref:glycosyltransferase family 4 protein n=1 Tax=Streptomyces uncialis TaxID=1048205 RepID=UPI002258F75D|nr:glycosyltransferase family 4 protein [Streptomyces uncialis]MCX4657965.1 glycosyltransferase family 4 protein [Streptomyces uncialis]